MTGFDSAFERTVGIEGGYSNRAADRGGPTKYGITERVARAHGYLGDMRDLPLSTAKMIYLEGYWRLLRLDEVERASWPIAAELFDTGVNMGVGVAGQFLQRALNALADAGLKVDGVLGPVTTAALRGYLAKRGGEGEVVMLRALNALQGARYIEITEHDQSQEANAYGWLRQRVAIA